MSVKNKEAKELILKAIEAKPGITRPELSKVTGLGKDMVRIEVERLSKRAIVHSEYYAKPSQVYGWYMSGVKTIIQRVEDAIRDADSPVNYLVIAAMSNLKPEQVANPLSKLMETKAIYRGENMTATNKDVFTYLHPDNAPALTLSASRANSLGMPLEEYERLAELELSHVLHDKEMRDFLNVYYSGSNATAQFLS